jgi:glycosyltransferase involved in cell wall biosynthesis
MMGAREDLEGTVDVTLFVPCYNEELNVARTLEKAVEAARQVGCSYELLVIDDASTDRTAEAIREFADAHPEVPVRMVRNPRNRGLAANFVEAARAGCGRYIRILCGDDVEPVETQVAILRLLDQADLILPYALDVANKPPFRKWLSRQYTRIVNAVSGQRLRYWNGCGLIPRQDVVRYPPRTRGFGFQAELVSRLLQLGRSHTHVGCRYVERRSGKSKAVTAKNLRSVIHVAGLIAWRRVFGPGRPVGASVRFAQPAA